MTALPVCDTKEPVILQVNFASQPMLLSRTTGEVLFRRAFRMEHHLLSSQACDGFGEPAQFQGISGSKASAALDFPADGPTIVAREPLGA